jgi:tol-pal system protein YbgF
VKAQATNQPLLELANQMQVMREDLRSLRGQIEVLSNGIEAGAKRQRDMYVDLDARMRRFEQNPGASPPAAPPPGAPVGAPPVVSAPPAATAPAVGSPGIAVATAPPGTAVSGAATPEEARIYEAAQAQRRIGNYPAAIASFQNFVKQFPRSTLAPRAQYWIGDSYYNQRDYKNAIANQQRLISSYPDSASVPDGLLNMASSYIEMGDMANARNTMDTIVARYPTSDAAEKARRRLATLR